MDAFIVKIMVVVFAALIGVSSVWVFKFKEDNPVEEATEYIIKEYTNIDVDLTPGSPENKDNDKGNVE